MLCMVCMYVLCMYRCMVQYNAVQYSIDRCCKVKLSDGNQGMDGMARF